MIGRLYRLTYPDGEDAAEFHSNAADWKPGDTFTTGAGRHQRIKRIVPLARMSEFLDELEYELWEVESAEI